jgi:uncharacterized protein involved in outer membrane biogenesis
MRGRAARILLWSVAGLAALLAAAALAAPFLIPAARLIPVIEAQASAALGAPVSIGSLRLRPGLSVRAEAGEVRVGGKAAPGGKSAAAPVEIARLEIGLRLLPLVRGEVRIAGLGAEGVRVRMRRRRAGWGLEGAPPGSLLGGQRAAGATGSPLATPATGAPPVGRVEVRDARISFTDSAGLKEEVLIDLVAALEPGTARLDPFRIGLGKERITGSLEWRAGEPPVLTGALRSERFDIDKALALAAALSPASAAASRPAAGAPAAPAASAPAVSGRLQVEIDAGRVVGMEFQDARAEAAYEKGRLVLHSLSAALYRGAVEGSGSVETGREPLPFEIRAEAREVDLEGALPALSPDLRDLLTGRFSGRLSLRGEGLDAPDLQRSLRGEVRLDLRDGKVASVSVLQQVAFLLEAVGGKGIGRESTPYRSISGDFEVRGGRAHTRNLALRSEDLDLDGEGSFGLDATLDFDLDGRFSPAVSEAMLAETSNLRHLVDKDGRLRVRLLMRGPLAAPKVTLDPAFLRRVMKRAAEERGREKLREKLEGLFR